MNLKDFEAMVLRQRPTEITAEVVASVRIRLGERARAGSAADPKRSPIHTRPDEGLVVDRFESEFSVGELTYVRTRPSDERWLLDHFYVVRPWFDEGKDWPEAPGTGHPVRAADPSLARERFTELYGGFRGLIELEATEASRGEILTRLRDKDASPYFELDDHERVLLTELET